MLRNGKTVVEKYYWFGGPPPTGLAEPGTDFHAIVNKRVAITPIKLDLTDRTLLDRIHGWEWQLDQEAQPDDDSDSQPRDA